MVRQAGVNVPLNKSGMAKKLMSIKLGTCTDTHFMIRSVYFWVMPIVDLNIISEHSYCQVISFHLVCILTETRPQHTMNTSVRLFPAVVP